MAARISALFVVLLIQLQCFVSPGHDYNNFLHHKLSGPIESLSRNVRESFVCLSVPSRKTRL